MTITTAGPRPAGESGPDGRGAGGGGAPARDLWFPLACYATGQLVLLGWWLALHPGLMSPDTVSYVRHVTTGPWIATHSVAYDALLRLSLRVAGDLSPVTLLQTTAMSAALTHLAGALRPYGPRRRWLVAAVGCAALLPPLGAFTVTMWKDVPFTICVLLAAGTAARIAARPRAASRKGDGAPNGGTVPESGMAPDGGTVPDGGAAPDGGTAPDGRRPRGRAWDPRLAALGAELLGAGLFRNNGFVVTLIAAALLVPLLPVARRWTAAVAAVAVAVPPLLTVTGYPALGIAPPPRVFAYQTVFGDLAVAYAERPGLFDRGQRELLTRIAPIETWLRGATCHTVTRVYFDPDFDGREAERHVSEVMDLWRDLLVRAPGVILDARLCRAALAWRIGSTAGDPGGELYRFSLRDPVLPPAWEGTPVAAVMRARPLSEGLRTAALTALDAAGAHRLEWLLWRGALWCHLCYAAAALARRRTGNRTVAAVAAVICAQQLCVLLTNTAQDFRFMVTPIIAGVLLLPTLLREVRALLSPR
ncbi:hypothetical protein ACFYSC_07760 [Streptosporangium sp. NPDC004379]|uniref:hypothetical protein n=1 Tax=Streptosporangium sp. NPDC004379 TaxID=3366189 RepID=UPI00369133F0